MNKKERIGWSAFIQSILGMIVIGGITGLTNEVIAFFAGVLLFLVQLYDGYELYPVFKSILKYFSISVLIVIGSVLFIALFHNVQWLTVLLTFVGLVVWISIMFIFLGGLVFMALYFVATLMHLFYLHTEKKENGWKETEILDDNFLKPAT